MFRNLTVRKVILFISGLLTTLNGVILLLLFMLEMLSISLLGIAIIVIVHFVITYILCNQFLSTYVFKKIEIIYKFIRSAKHTKESGMIEENFEKKTLEDINREVLEWGKSTTKEIESLKNLEVYRKNFVGNISHELKTPIFSILGYLHTLLDGGIYDDKVNLKYLNRAVKNTERLQYIVEDLEVINRLEGGIEVMDIQSFDIIELIKDVFIDLEELSKSHDIKLIFRKGHPKVLKVRADRESIRQVLTNLLVNSIKYGEPGGITRVGLFDMETNILVEISDTGIGISENHLQHVFDRFYRVDTSRSREQGGSGLGLSIVKHIIEAHGQTINVRSTPGVGTTFGFTLEK